MSRTNTRALAAAALCLMGAPLAEAQQGTITIRFDGQLSTPTTYVESGLTARSMGMQLLLSGGALTNQVGPTGPYRFGFDGQPFTVVGFDVLSATGMASFVNDQGRVFNVPGPGTYVLPAGQWSNVTFLEWRQLAGTMRIDNLRVQRSQDTRPPVVLILSPADGTYDRRSSVPVSANVRDDAACTVWTTPAAAEGAVGIPPSPDGTSILLMVPMPPADGDVAVTVWARDQAGNVALASLTIHHDRAPPALSFRSPGGGSVSGTAEVGLAFSVADASPVDVVAASRTFPFGAGGGEASFLASFAEGPHTVVATATDRAGNTSQASIEFVVDLTSPIVSIDSPAEGEVFGPSSPAAPLSFTVDDSTAVDYETSPSALAGTLPPGGGIVSGAVSLVEGENTIGVSATDQGGRTASASVRVVLDTTPPHLLPVFPTGGEYLRGDALLQVWAEDVRPGSGIGSVGLSIDGGPERSLAAGEGGSWSLLLSTADLADGPHRLTFRAVDGLGSASGISVEVVVDNTPPEVRIASPAEGECLCEGDVIHVEAFDAGSGLFQVALEAGGDRVAESDQAPLEVALDPSERPDGPLALRGVAVDRAGNSAEASIAVVVDAAPPSVSIVSPADGAVVAGRFDLAVELVDAALGRVEFLVDGRSLAVLDAPPYSVSIDTLAAFDGAYALEVVATDGCGQTARDAVRVVSDNMAFSLEPNRVAIPASPPRRVAHGRDGRRLEAVIEAANLDLLGAVEGMDLRLVLPDGTALRPTEHPRGRLQWSRTDADGDGVPELRVVFDRIALVNALKRGLRSNRFAPARLVGIELVAGADRSIGTFLLGIDR